MTENTQTPEQKLAELGIELPEVAAPVAAYIPTRRQGNLVYTSGQVPFVNGELAQTGKVGAEVSLEEGQKLAATCVVNALAAIKAEIGELSAVTGVIKVVGFVSSDPEFYGQAQVINGASELLGQVFGEAGAHARSAVGMAVLPLNAPVEVELVVEVAQ